MLQRLRAEPRILARWAPSILLGLILCAGPLWLWGVPLRWFFLKSDDFVYLARSRTPAALRDHLVPPHNGHVVPLFLLETHLLARLAGSLEALPAVLGWASYATVVLAMAATGHVVAWETGRTVAGLAAMAAVGLTSVLGPTLLVVRGRPGAGGRDDGRGHAGGAAGLAGRRRVVVAGPGPAGGDGGAPVLVGRLCRRPGRHGLSLGRRPARLPARGGDPRGCSLAMAVLVWCVAGRGFAPASHLAAAPAGRAAGDGRGAHTAQAVCEALVLNNLGLDATTTAGQALLFCALLAGLWWWSR